MKWQYAASIKINTNYKHYFNNNVLEMNNSTVGAVIKYIS